MVEGVEAATFTCASNAFNCSDCCVNCHINHFSLILTIQSVVIGIESSLLPDVALAPTSKETAQKLNQTKISARKAKSSS